jgi:ribosomal peptide maturation radical SAM protein 1
MVVPPVHVPNTDVLLIVPPVARLSRPALGIEVLAACARAAGHRVHVLYANLWFGAAIGEVGYARLANAPTDALLGERVFAKAAFGASKLGATDGLDGHERAALAFVDAIADAAVASGARVVGCTSSYEQTAASLAILDRVKRRDARITTILGGANCEGAMADGIRSIGIRMDHVFAGESEATFLEFLRAHAAGEPTPAIVTGAPCRDLDALPSPAFDQWFEQLAAVLPDLSATVGLAYESSRGCWWGEKRHCTFCGLNGTGMAFRAKSPERVLADLAAYARYPTRYVAMADNIMPHAYHRTLIPRLGGDWHVFYEQKANLTLDQVDAMRSAGVRTLQPGIESLSSNVLRLMRKGVLARQNLALLRYARAVGTDLHWNLLYALPNDDEADYAEIVELIPRIVHLQPPEALAHLSIDRFSPYFDEPERYGISDVRPLPAYADVFPTGTDTAALAYHFTGTWTSGSRGSSALMGQLRDAVQRWRDAWTERAPALMVTGGGDRFVLIDTRGGSASTWQLNRAQAMAVLVGGPDGTVPAAGWAIRSGFAVAMDGWCVPLAVAKAGLLREMEAAGDVDGAAVEGMNVLR